MIISLKKNKKFKKRKKLKNKEEFNNDESLSIFDLGIEFWEMIKRFRENEETIPRERNEFFHYLITSLNNLAEEYSRKGEGIIHIPHWKKERFNRINEIVLMTEKSHEKKLSNFEKVQAISLWLQISDDEAWKLFDEMRIINTEVVSLDEEINDDLETDADTRTMHDETPSKSLDSQEEFIEKSENQKLCDAVETTINRKSEGTRKCYRALFTLYCNNKKVLFKEIIPLLDCEILELCKKSEEKPTQKEIYMKYYPEAKEDSAETSVSRLLKDFFAELKESYTSSPN